MTQPSFIWLCIIRDQGQDTKEAKVCYLLPRTPGSVTSFDFSHHYSSVILYCMLSHKCHVSFTKLILTKQMKNLC